MTASSLFIIGAGGSNPVIYSEAQSVFVDSGADCNVDPALLMKAIDTMQAEGTRVIDVLCRALGAV